MLLAELILSVVVCLDVLLVAVSYGAARIRIGALPALVLSLLSAGVLGISLAAAGVLSNYLSAALCGRLSGGALLALGIGNVFQTLLKRRLRRAQGDRKLRFSCCQMNFVLEVFLDETRADRDCSKTLCCREAVWLALAFSFDSLACGLSAGLQAFSPLRASALCLVCGLVFVAVGTRLGARLGRSERDLGWLSGLCLLLLGVWGLLG